MKKTLFIFIFILIGFSAQSVLADTPLEVVYPDLTSVHAPVDIEKTNIADYAKYIFYFIIAVGGFAALITLIGAGADYIMSAGNPDKINTAKDGIKSAIFGLILLFASWLILYTINPSLIFFDIDTLRPSLPNLSPGVLLCKKDLNFVHSFWKIRNDAEKMETKELKEKGIKEQLEAWQKIIHEECWLVPTSGNIPTEFSNKTIIHAHVIPSVTNQRYGAILYGESDYGGKNQIVFTSKFEPYRFDVSKLGVKSVRPFIMDNNVGRNWYVELFELIDYNAEYKKPERKQQGINYQKIPVKRVFQCSSVVLPEKTGVLVDDHQFQSVNIEGDVIVVFFRYRPCEREWTSVTELYALIHDDSRLNDNRPIGEWKGGLIDPYPYATSVAIISGGIY